MNKHRVIPVSTFNKSTSFAIDPARINVIESLYPGYIEVHLLNYQYDDRITYPGGSGLTLAGEVEHIVDGGRLYGRLALIAGIAEVFAVHSNYDSVVVLRPLTTGLGVRWQLYSAAQALTAFAKARQVKAKFSALATKQLSACRNYVTRITGSSTLEPGASYFLREHTESKCTPRKHRKEIQLPQAITMDDAKGIMRERIAWLRLQGWTCGEESSFQGTMTKDTECTVAWLCKRGSAIKRITLKYGLATPADAESRKEFTRTSESYTAEEIADMWDTWARFDGFSGETCGHCHLDVNVCAYGPGWICNCGHYNCQSFSHNQMPHEHPDFGPNRKTIKAGADQSKTWQELLANVPAI